MKKLTSKDIAFLGLLAALVMTLSFLETLLPPLPALPPGFKMGISNIAVMYALFCGGFGYGLVLCVLKSVFILFVNGGYAFVLSLCGTLLAISVMSLMIALFKQKVSYIALSVSGALCHNAAQIMIVGLITRSAAVFYYSPVLVLASVLCGGATAAAVKASMPILSKVKK